MKILNCADCGQETECEWCDVCARPVCDECDLFHDCISDHLTTDDELSDDDGPTPVPEPEDGDEDLFDDDDSDDDSTCGEA